MRAAASPPSRSHGPAGRRCKEKRVLLNFARPTVPIRSPLPAAIAALLCISLPAGGQDHTPDRARKTGTVAPTSVGVSFKEWTVPADSSSPLALLLYAGVLIPNFPYEDGQIRLDENFRPARRVRETLLEFKVPIPSLVVSSSTRDYRDMHLDGHKRLRREAA